MRYPVSREGSLLPTGSSQPGQYLSIVAFVGEKQGTPLEGVFILKHIFPFDALKNASITSFLLCVFPSSPPWGFSGTNA